MTKLSSEYDETFPKYYEVDDIPVKLFVDPKDNKVYAVNDLGNPANLAKVIVEGHEISLAEFNRLSRARANDFKAFREGR